MTKWKIKRRTLVQWNVWDCMVLLADGKSILELSHGMSERLGIENLKDRFMDYRAMQNYMLYVNSTFYERLVFRSMTDD